MIDSKALTRVSETSLITAAAPIARLSHGEVFQGKLTRTWLAGQTVWEGQVTGTKTGKFVTPKGLR